MCKNKKCICNKKNNPPVCTSFLEPTCNTGVTTSNTLNPDGNSDSTVLHKDTCNILAYNEHLEFVKPSGVLTDFKGYAVLRFAKKFLDSLVHIFKGSNVGEGKGIYKGFSQENFTQEFKSLLSSDDLVVLTDNFEDISFSIDKVKLKEIIESSSGVLNLDTDAVINKSVVSGVTTTDALNNIQGWINICGTGGAGINPSYNHNNCINVVCKNNHFIKLQYAINTVASFDLDVINTDFKTCSFEFNGFGYTRDLIGVGVANDANNVGTPVIVEESVGNSVRVMFTPNHTIINPIKLHISYNSKAN